MKRNTETMTEIEAAKFVSDVIMQTMQHLQDTYGLTPKVILAGAHASVVSAMTMAMGGKATAESCERAARNVEGLPSIDVAKLAASPVFGHA